MSRKERIIFLYYEKKLNTVEISNNLKISKQYVSKIIKTDIRFNDEKVRRKNNNAAIRKRKKQEYKKSKRQRMKDERLEAFIEMQHRQATGELSGRRIISNRAFKKWNTSIYEYHDKTKEFRLKKELKNKTSYSIPKKIKWS